MSTLDNTDLHPDVSGPRYGRRSGPDAPRPVPFKREMLPGVTFVQACEQIGQRVLAGIKRADHPALFTGLRAESDADRDAAALSAVRAIAKGTLTVGRADRIIVRGAKFGAYTQKETAVAIVQALTFLKSENPPQLKRYCERIADESDRALGIGTAGQNPLGWSDGFLSEDAPSIKRASADAIARASDVRADRSGENSPQAKHARTLTARSEAAQERERQEADRVKRAAATARKRAAAEARKGASEGGSDSEGQTVARKPRRPRKGA